MKRKNVLGSFLVAFSLIAFANQPVQAGDNATTAKPAAAGNTSPTPATSAPAPTPAPATGTAPQTPSNPSSSSADPEVKKAKASGICHDKSSPSYKQTKNFLPFNSMDECLKSGGKPLKK